MILIDSRTGSKELLCHFPSGKAKLTTLDFADFSITGNGKDGVPVLIGIERKTLGDMLQSFVSGRFAGHQLPGLINSYGVVILLIEGQYRANPNSGILEFFQYGKWQDAGKYGKPWMFRDFENRINTVKFRAGVTVEKTISPVNTAHYLMALEHWWNKPWDDHQSHMAIHYDRPRYATAEKIDPFRKMVACLPNISWKKSERICNRFRNFAEMVTATEKEWLEVEGIGKKTVASIKKIIGGA